LSWGFVFDNVSLSVFEMERCTARDDTTVPGVGPITCRRKITKNQRSRLHASSLSRAVNVFFLLFRAPKTRRRCTRRGSLHVSVNLL
jgi:hypothetical protein